MHYELADKFVVPEGPERVWEFFSSPGGLPKITPPWLDFQLVPPVASAIRLHTRLEYRIRWIGMPFRWSTKIVDWTPPNGFVDLQIRGPYTFWYHRHSFVPVAGGTRCTDSVVYKVPGGPLGVLLHEAVIRRQLLDIFRYRRRAVAEELGWVRALQRDVSIRRLG